MKIQNLLKFEIDSAIENIPTLKNFFEPYVPKYKKEKMKKSVYGVVGGNSDSFDSDGGSGGE
jgi:hypothetical protein